MKIYYKDEDEDKDKSEESSCSGDCGSCSGCNK